jgi:hypothetical protein
MVVMIVISQVIVSDLLSYHKGTPKAPNFMRTQIQRMGILRKDVIGGLQKKKKVYSSFKVNDFFITCNNFFFRRKLMELEDMAMQIALDTNRYMLVIDE